MCNFPEVSLYSLVKKKYIYIYGKSLILTENCSLKEKLRGKTHTVEKNILFTCKLSISEIKSFKTKKNQYGSSPALHLWLQINSVFVLFTCVIQAV